MMRPPYSWRRRMSALMAGVAMMASLPTTTLLTPLPAAMRRMICARGGRGGERGVSRWCSWGSGGGHTPNWHCAAL